MILASQACSSAQRQPSPTRLSYPAPPPSLATTHDDGRNRTVPAPREERESAPPSTRASATPTPSTPPASPESTDDEQISETVDVSEARIVRSPLADLSSEQLTQKVRDELPTLGSLSIGRTNGGMLLNGVQMPQGPHWDLTDPSKAWGTQETIDALVHCIEAVHRQFPDSPKMQVGHISARNGGPLKPHKSHQAGRDVDISYFYKNRTSRWYTRANARNLDRARTWAFVRALITDTDVQLILIDRRLQRLLKKYALSIGEDRAWLDDVFGGTPGKRPALIRHARGHATHIHVRFYSPKARARALVVYPILVKLGKLKAPTAYETHRARKGDTLGRLARRYGTTVQAIRKANGLRSTKIRAGRRYRIPTQQNLKPPHQLQVVVPPRRLPPHPPFTPTAAAP